MRGKYYAQALHEVLLTTSHSEETLLKHFIETVRANGHAYLFPKIVRAYESIIAKEVKASTIVVVSAKPLTDEKVVALLKKEPFKNALSMSHKKVSRMTDDNIIGGVVVRTGTTRIDASHKRALLDIYQSLISQ